MCFLWCTRELCSCFTVYSTGILPIAHLSSVNSLTTRQHLKYTNIFSYHSLQPQCFTRKWWNTWGFFSTNYCGLKLWTLNCGTKLFFIPFIIFIFKKKTFKRLMVICKLTVLFRSLLYKGSRAGHLEVTKKPGSTTSQTMCEVFIKYGRD